MFFAVWMVSFKMHSDVDLRIEKVLKILFSKCHYYSGSATSYVQGELPYVMYKENYVNDEGNKFLRSRFLRLFGIELFSNLWYFLVSSHTTLSFTKLVNYKIFSVPGNHYSHFLRDSSP